MKVRATVILLALAAGEARASPELPDGPGRDVVERTCGQCHALEVVLRSRLTERQWSARIDEMIARGARLSDDDADLAAAYLARFFGPVEDR